jgi:acylphosphatase
VTLTRYDITFTGRVQGVFFRATACDVAEGFAVTGWVRNERDGSVRCVVEGERGELDAFVQAVQKAKSGFIKETLITPAPANGDFVGFETRYDA